MQAHKTWAIYLASSISNTLGMHFVYKTLWEGLIGSNIQEYHAGDRNSATSQNETDY